MSPPQTRGVIVTGAEVLPMRQLAALALVAIGLTAVGCRTAGDGSSVKAAAIKSKGADEAPASGTHRVKLSSTNANELMAILVNAGVKESAIGIGSSQRQADKIECSEAVVPSPVPTCTIFAAGASYKVEGDAGKNLYEILAVNGGLYANGEVGTSTSRATHIECSHPVTPEAKAACIFDVAGNETPARP